MHLIQAQRLFAAGYLVLKQDLNAVRLQNSRLLEKLAVLQQRHNNLNERISRLAVRLANLNTLRDDD